MTNNFELEELIYPINHDVVVNYKPQTSYIYTYKVFRDGKIIDEKEVNSQASLFKLRETGAYVIQVERFVNNEQVIEKTEEIIIDKEAPVINLKEKRIIMTTSDKLNVMNNVVATDNYDGELTELITTNIEDLDLTVAGEKKLIYTIKDQAGNETTEMVQLIVTSGINSNIIYGQISIMVAIIIAIILILRIQRIIKLEKRISKYSVKPIKDNSKSFFDTIIYLSYRHRKIITKLVEKSKFLTKCSSFYQSKVNIRNYAITCEEIFAEKILTGVLFVILAFISKVINLSLLTPLEFLFAYIIGSLVPDVFYMIETKIYYNKLENDLLQAITIMNKAFKSGKSITQAVALVAKELEGPIANEFEKMRVELSFGLDLTTVFTRFSERIKIEEASYLTSSLTILNNTGGNIIKVFDSIEESLFNKKKIKLELETLTASSKIILYVLFVVPILFMLVITLIDPTFFAPFFSSIFGIIYFGALLITYLLYIIILRKIMKVRF